MGCSDLAAALSPHIGTYAGLGVGTAGGGGKQGSAEARRLHQSPWAAVVCSGSVPAHGYITPGWGWGRVGGGGGSGGGKQGSAEATWLHQFGIGHTIICHPLGAQGLRGRREGWASRSSACKSESRAMLSRSCHYVRFTHVWLCM